MYFMNVSEKRFFYFIYLSGIGCASLRSSQKKHLLIKELLLQKIKCIYTQLKHKNRWY